jgi:hypothetical protein
MRRAIDIVDDPKAAYWRCATTVRSFDSEHARRCWRWLLRSALLPRVLNDRGRLPGDNESKGFRYYCAVLVEATIALSDVATLSLPGRYARYRLRGPAF